jgi:hypothetical protein
MLFLRVMKVSDVRGDDAGLHEHRHLAVSPVPPLASFLDTVPAGR